MATGRRLAGNETVFRADSILPIRLRQSCLFSSKVDGGGPGAGDLIESPWLIQLEFEFTVNGLPVLESLPARAKNLLI